MGSTSEPKFNKAQKKSWQMPWARRSIIWDPPTTLDRILESPLKFLVMHIQAVLLWLRGAPFKPPYNKHPIRIVCISDTHCNAGMTIPAGDLLIHAGDLTNAGTIAEIQEQINWLDSLPHKEKIVICGNHDSYFDPKSRKPEDRSSNKKLIWPKNIHYLENKSLTLSFKGGRKLNFYGSPDVPAVGGSDHAFQYERGSDPWENRIPMATDVLITHTPPKHHVDLDLGCEGLLKEIWEVKPKLHVVGHVHSAHGREALFWDEGQRAYERIMARCKGGIITDLLAIPRWFDALRGT